jgi:arylsulfatase A-like enzyme
MKKQTTIIVLSILFAAVVLASVFLFLNKNQIGVSKHSTNHNIVIIVSDALRSDVLGCYGGDAETPNIDWLAEKGVLFENAYSTAPCTMPASVSMLTGNFSRAYGIIQKDEHKNRTHKYSFYVNDNEKLFAEALREIGFDVKMDIENSIAARSNNLQGFEAFRKSRQMSKEEIAIVENTIGVKNTAGNKKPLLSHKYNRLYDLLYYLLTVPENRNFFLLKWFSDPHGPYDPKEKFKKKIPLVLKKLPMKESFYSKSKVREFNKLVREKNFSDYEHFYIKALYKAEVESVDERVGYIIQALKHRKLLEKTFIVFTSDHGEMFGEHGRLGHGHDYYEDLVNIPLITMGPGIPQGKREKTVVSLLDLMPTLKDLLGVKYADNMQGKSFSTLFYKGSIQDRILYFDRISNTVTKKVDSDALLMNGYKLIINKENNRYVFELFNLSDDPGEIKDIFRENREIVQKMFKKILDIRKDNKVRLKRNLAKIDKDVNLDKEWKKTMEELKTLGYL